MLWLVSLASSRKSYFKRSERVNEYIICLCTSLEENWFTCKISGSLVLWLVSFAKEEEAILKEVKGLMNKLYAYALVRKKTGLHANFQVHWCYG